MQLKISFLRNYTFKLLLSSWYFFSYFHLLNLKKKQKRGSRCSGCLSIFFKKNYRFWLVFISGGEEIGNFNNWIASNLLFCTYHFNNVYKIILPVLLPVCSNYLCSFLKMFKYSAQTKINFKKFVWNFIINCCSVCIKPY